MYDDVRLHIARSYTSSAESPYSLMSSFTLSNHLLLGLPLFLLPCTFISVSRYHLPETRAEAARSSCCYLRKRCESAAPRIFCPRLAPGASLCMRFLRRHSVRTQIRFVGDVARKRKEHEDNRRAVANVCKDERISSQAERFRFPPRRAPIWSMF